LVTLAVAVPGTALAKGPIDARVDGPGLAQPIALDWDTTETDLSALIDATGFWDLANRPAGVEPSALGPRFTVTFTMYDADGAGTPLVLHAYPFAEPNPAVYVPAGQTAFEIGAVPEGWRASPAALTTWFERQGVPAKAAGPSDRSATPEAGAAAPPPSGSGGSRPAWLLVAAGVAVAAVAALVVRLTRRREAAPAH
jgi:hypothetical protein